MQTLPANGQAQTLPAKWVIKRTPENAEMVNKWANEQPGYFNYAGTDGFIYSHPMGSYAPYLAYVDNWQLGFTLITDTQFKAMVEGEEPDIATACAEKQEWEKAKEYGRKEHIMYTYNCLLGALEDDLAAALKAKHPDIWPVDYAAIVLEKAVALDAAYKFEDDGMDRASTIVYSAKMELRAAVRNYLTNQK